MRDMSFINNFDQRNKNLLFALFAILILRIIVLGAYPLMDTTEARYAEIARVMVTTNNWITPQLDPGKPFWGKPPLSTWATALSFKLLGISEFTARLPSLFFALGNMFFVFILARNLVNTTFALKVLIVLSTTGLFYFMAGGVMTDPALSFSVTVSMVSFLLALRGKPGHLIILWKYLFFVGLGLSLLSKGPVGIVLTFFPIFLWVTYKKKWGHLFHSLPWGMGILLTSAIALPWHILAEIKTPGFLKYYFIGENLNRFAVTGWKGNLYGNAHSQFRGMIWLFLIPTTLPWIIFFIANIQSIIRRNKIVECIAREEWVSYLVFWYLTPMIFFTFAGNILMTYILPGLPAFALLMVYLIQFNQNINVSVDSKWYTSPKGFAFFALIMPLIFTVVSFTIFPKVGLRRSHKLIGQTFNKKILGNSRLIYTRKMPYSADFYSNGAAYPMRKGMDEDEMLKYLNDGTLDFYVVRNEDVGHFLSSFYPLISRVQTFDGYIIFKDNKVKSNDTKISNE